MFAKLYLVFIFNILKSEFEYRKQKGLLPFIIFVKIKTVAFCKKTKFVHPINSDMSH